MIRKRHEVIGIKQIIRFEWMTKTAELQSAGLEDKLIRDELHQFLSNKKGDGTDGPRSDQTRTFLVNNLMNIWATPEPDLIYFRNSLLKHIRNNSLKAQVIHWSMICAAYPFWYNVALHAGRLLSLQDQVTQTQIVNRLKEQYGDRQTISRYARYVVRSFVAWGVLVDAGTKGCYVKSPQISVDDNDLIIHLFEASLFAIPEKKFALNMMLNNPAFFPFRFPSLTGSLISQRSDRIEVVRYGLDDDLLYLKSDNNSSIDTKKLSDPNKKG